MDGVTRIIGCACDFDRNNVITSVETSELKCIYDQQLFFDNRYIDSGGFQYQDTNKDDAIDLQEATNALKDHIKYEQNYYMFFDGIAGKWNKDFSICFKVFKIYQMIGSSDDFMKFYTTNLGISLK